MNENRELSDKDLELISAGKTVNNNKQGRGSSSVGTRSLFAGVSSVARAAARSAAPAAKSSSKGC